MQKYQITIELPDGETGKEEILLRDGEARAIIDVAMMNLKMLGYKVKRIEFLDDN